MTFQINGEQGKYNSVEMSDSVRYGRNATENLYSYMESPIVNDNQNSAPILDFKPTEEAENKNVEALNKFADKNDEYLNSLPPLEFEYRYMPKLPKGSIDKEALLGAAYEEMNGVQEVSLKEFENKYLLDDSMTAEPLDINKDGKIDLAEYSTTILAADILSKDSADVKNVDGVMNSKGMNAVMEYSKKSNAQAAAKLYSEIYNTYGLGSSDNLK